MNVPPVPEAPPTLLCSFPVHEAAKQLTADVLAGKRYPRAAQIDESAKPLGDEERFRPDDLRDLIDDAMDRFADQRTAADAWLAPRLHATLRLTRREAGDAGIWNHLSFRVAPDYVLWRHPPTSSARNPAKQTNAARFSGAYHTQTFARLWWAAELFRNGPDYRPAEVFCGNQDMLNTALRMEIAYHPATAQTLIAMLDRSVVRTGRDVNALAKAINTAGSTLLYEVLAPVQHPDVDAYRDWVEALGVHVPHERLPDGPPDHSVSDGDIELLLPLFERLFKEAPVRGKPPMNDEV